MRAVKSFVASDLFQSDILELAAVKCVAWSLLLPRVAAACRSSGLYRALLCLIAWATTLYCRQLATQKEHASLHALLVIVLTGTYHDVQLSLWDAPLFLANYRTSAAGRRCYPITAELLSVEAWNRLRITRVQGS